MNKLEAGQGVYIIANGNRTETAVITNYTAGFYTLRFCDRSGGTRLKEHRLFSTRKEAENAITSNGTFAFVITVNSLCFRSNSRTCRFSKIV